MEKRINKPRVFLSHSKIDRTFVENLASDLRRCQIEPWLDTEEIRDGRPWLKVIFEDGIPTCDSVIVYLTQHSLRSAMVAKEMDAALIEQLRDSGISFLPYVSDAGLREMVRGDIRSLQCREWNDANYNEILPSVVAEIWRSYMERAISTATLHEKNRRLELELELKNLRERFQDDVFTRAEEKDFEYIYSRLNKSIEITFNVQSVKDANQAATVIGVDTFNVPFLFMLALWANEGHNYYSWDEVWRSLEDHLEKKFLKPRGISARYSGIKVNPPEIAFDLRQYGLTRAVAYEVDSPRLRSFGPSVRYRDEFTEKFDRFRYWIEYNNYSFGEVEYIRFQGVND